MNLAPTATYSITLNPAGVAKVDLYVTTDGSRPSETNFQFASVRINGPEQVRAEARTRLQLHDAPSFPDVVGTEAVLGAARLLADRGSTCCDPLRRGASLRQCARWQRR